jgi:CubicO group peptidase (beta-lactamase class C family)
MSSIVGSEIQGQTEPAFDAVRKTFEEQFAAGRHLGAGVSVYHHGRKVVDLWGGIADEASGRRWEENTMAVCYSTTKGLAATCVHILADRGKLSYDDLVAKHWPEFAANGKEKITIYHILTHQAGIPQIPEGTTADDVLDWDTMARGMASLEPIWEPGTDSGYHALNFGWLTGEIVRRVDGRSVGQFLREEVCEPLGLQHMHIGAPESAEPLISTLRSPELTPEMEAQRAAYASSDALFVRASHLEGGRLDEILNSRAGHAAQIPAVSGVMTARDLARLYACLGNGGELDGVRLMSAETVRRASERQTYRADRVIMIPIGWALGYMTGGSEGWPQGTRVSAFGHAGLGGSIGYCDPEVGLAFGFVPNQLASDLIGYGRTAELAAVARECAEAAG